MMLIAMRATANWSALLFCMLLCLGCTSSPEPREWRGEASAQLQGVAVDGTLGAGTRTRTIDADLGDVIEGDGDPFGYAGALEVGHGPWALRLVAARQDLGADTLDSPSGRESFAADQTFVTATAWLEVARFDRRGSAREADRAPTIEVGAGARSCDVDLRLDSTIVPVATGTRDWIDPLIGARATLPLSNNSYVITSGDVGGFSLGSDFCWSLEALVGIDLFVARQRTALQFGYRALGIDYDAGAVGDEFVLDAVQHGPVLVFAIAF